MDYKTIWVPSLLTGFIAGAADFLAKQTLGWKVALYSALAVAIVQGARMALEKYNNVPPKVDLKTGIKLKVKPKLFIGE